MNTLSYKTVSANKETAKKEWLVVDADGQTLGRLASKIAMLIRGKYKTNFTPHVDCDNKVVAINSEKSTLAGIKSADTSYTRRTPYPDGQKSLTGTEMFDKEIKRCII